MKDKEKRTTFFLFRILTILILGFGIVSMLISLTQAEEPSQGSLAKSYMDEAANDIQSAKDEIENAENRINQAKSSGIDVFRAEKTLSEAKHLLSMSQDKFEKANLDYNNEKYRDATHFAKSTSTLAKKALNLAKESITLIPGLGKISISSNPSGANVYIDGDYKGKTPLELSISPSTYTIKLTMTGYEDYVKGISVKSGEKTYVNVPLTSKQGKISISSNPSGAKVYLLGEYKGKTPLELDIYPATYTLKITKDGYENYIKKITVKYGEKTSEVAILTPKPGKIIVSSDPSSASVSLNGEYKGMTPLELSISSGNYTIKLTKDGYEDYVKGISVKSGEKTYVNATLSLKPISIKGTFRSPVAYIIIGLICFLGIISAIILYKRSAGQVRTGISRRKK